MAFLLINGQTSYTIHLSLKDFTMEKIVFFATQFAFVRALLGGNWFMRQGFWFEFHQINSEEIKVVGTRGNYVLGV